MEQPTMVLSREQYMTSDTVQLTSHSDSIKFGSDCLGTSMVFWCVRSVRCNLISTICLSEVDVLYCFAALLEHIFCFVFMALPTSLQRWRLQIFMQCDILIFGDRPRRASCNGQCKFWTSASFRSIIGQEREFGKI